MQTPQGPSPRDRPPEGPAEGAEGKGPKGSEGSGHFQGSTPLSEEELQGLLGGDPGNGDEASRDPQRTGAEIQRVLAVSRDEGEIQLLRGVLGSFGVEVMAVKNPFSALDQLRLRKYIGIISDFAIWAEKGGLLFSRLGTGADRPAVVFICETSKAASDARSTEAACVLTRPLRPVDVARLSRFFAPAGQGVGSRAGGSPEVRPVTPTPLAAPSARAPEKEGIDEVPLPAEVQSPSPSQNLTNGIGPFAEVRWLRFLFESRRAARQVRTCEKKIEAILERFHRDMGPYPCGVGIAREEGWWIFALPGSQDVLPRIGLALLASSQGCGSWPSPSGESRGGPERPPPSEILIQFLAFGRPAVFAALLDSGDPHRALEKAEIPEKYLQELAAILGESCAEVSPRNS